MQFFHSVVITSHPSDFLALFLPFLAAFICSVFICSVLFCSHMVTMVPAFLSCDDNALEEMFKLGNPPAADSSSSLSSISLSDSLSSEDEAEMGLILAKCVKKHVYDTVHNFFGGCMMLCFVLCLREEGLRIVMTPYFGQPAFRHCHFVIKAGGGGLGGIPPPPPPTHHIHPCHNTYNCLSVHSDGTIVHLHKPFLRTGPQS